MNRNRCGVCGAERRKATTSFTIDYKTGIVVIRNVPALVCMQCGEEWIPDDIAAKLEGFAEAARRGKRQVEVVDFARTVAA